MQEHVQIVTVSQLNRQVKNVLEYEIGPVRVEGEVSNLSQPQSGHRYFTLKDSAAQVRCVFFKSRHSSGLTEALSDGQNIVASGTLSLYEARGDYQLIINHITKAGLGALYQKFEELKKKLSSEGLFDTQQKKPIPIMPKAIGLITSTSGAAIRDILSTLARRFPLANVIIYPSEVQGNLAPAQLIKALKRANSDQRCDVLILTRGGGSIEDLWAFNDEQLAREIARSDLPIVSGVGHETDFTIADFVADYRAETPTAAATAVTPDALELLAFIQQIQTRLHRATASIIQSKQLKLTHLMDKIASPKSAIASFWQRLDFLDHQLVTGMSQLIYRKEHQLHILTATLDTHSPKNQIAQTRVHLTQLSQRLVQLIQHKTTALTYRLNTHLATLHAVSPLATLDRGYAIASRKGMVVLTAKTVHLGDTIEVRLAEGSLECEVLQINE